MKAPNAPTAADLYLRSIAFAAVAVVVAVLAVPLAAGLALAGLVLEERARDGEPFGFAAFGVSQAGDQGGLVPVLFGAAAGVFLVGFVCVLVLAFRSAAALSRAGRAPHSSPASGDATAAPAPPSRRSRSLAAAPMLASRPAASNGAGEATATASSERVVVLTDGEKVRLGAVTPASVTSPGWYVDPLGQAGGRWWNGKEWTGRLKG